MKNSLTILGLLLMAAAAARSQAPAPPPPSNLPAPAPPASVPSSGLAAEGEKRWDDALRIYRSILEKEPARADLWKRVADIEGALGRKGPAADALVKAAEATPDQIGPWLEAARALSADGRTEQALALCDRAHALNPQSLDTLRLRATYANWAKKPAIAADTCEMILKLTPEDDATRLMLARSRVWSGDPDRGVAAYREYVTRRPEDGPATLEYAAVESFRGDYPRALELVDGHLARFGETEEAKTLRADIVARSKAPPTAGVKAELEKRWEDALKVYRDALEKDPTKTDLWKRIADIEAAQGRKAEAADALVKAAEATPDDPAVWLAAARALAAAGSTDRALAAVERALTLRPDDLDLLRARVDYATWAKKPAVAVETCEKILKLAPDDPQARLLLARSRAWTGDLDKAAESFREQVARRPDDRQALLEYAALESYRGDFPHAFELIDQYREKFGPTEEEKAVRADFLARAKPPAPIRAQTGEIPPEGLKAESEKRWEDALTIYRAALEREPERPDLWLRAADVQAALGRMEESRESIRRAAAVAAETGRPEIALEAVDRALIERPDDVELLRNRVEYLNWAKKPELAAETCQKILKLAPEDDKARLTLARSRAWANQLDKSAEAYADYLAHRPEDAVASIEQIEIEAYRGDYARAFEHLEAYRARFGETLEERRARAFLYAGASRPTAARAVLDPLLKEEPESYAVHLCDTIALYNDRRLRDAIESLKTLDRLDSNSPQTIGMHSYCETPLRPAVSLGFDVYEESDSLQILHGEARGQFASSPETTWLFGAEGHQLEADIGSGLDTRLGDETAVHGHTWAGVRHRFFPWMEIEARAGASQMSSEEDAPSSDREEDHQTVTYLGAIDFRPRDNLTVSVRSDHGFLIISPRASSYGIRKYEHRVRVVWEPDLRHTVDVGAGWMDLSDDNNRWDTYVSVRRAFLRIQHLNFEMGPYCSWFGYGDRLIGHGYYDPGRSQRYALNLYPYWKIDENNVIGATVSAGYQEDDVSNKFKFGTSYSGEAVFGIRNDVMLRLYGGETRNQSVLTGSFRAWNAGIEVTLRF